MARILIVGCGCRGRALAGVLRTDGHVVRGTTRAAANRPVLTQAGIEPWVGDPDRVGSLVYAMDNVTLLCVLLGSAHGTPDELAALHGPRLRMLLEKTVDTTVRGVLYEGSGSVAGDVLERGAGICRDAARTWEIPLVVLHADLADHRRWPDAARRAIDRLLAADRAALAKAGATDLGYSQK